MRFCVLRKVVRSHEPLVTSGTREPLLSSVGPQMSLEFVWASESLATEQPVAHKRPLSCVPPQVGLQVRRLPVYFSTSGNVTIVQVLFSQVRPGGPQPLGLLTVGAVTDWPARVSPLWPRAQWPAGGWHLAQGAELGRRSGGRPCLTEERGCLAAQEAVRGQAQGRGRGVVAVVCHRGRVHLTQLTGRAPEVALHGGGRVHVPPAAGPGRLQGVDLALDVARPGPSGRQPGLVGRHPGGHAAVHGLHLELGRARARNGGGEAWGWARGRVPGGHLGEEGGGLGGGGGRLLRLRRAWGGGSEGVKTAGTWKVITWTILSCYNSFYSLWPQSMVTIQIRILAN